ncbi:MAG: hypothetical protein ACRDGU_02235 [Actinomycetota bacterium]
MDQEKQEGWALERLSRRRMLKRVGAGAAVAWSAPILSSLRTPAFAQYPARCEVCAEVCGESVGTPGGPCNCFDDVEGNGHCTNNFNCAGSRACTSSAECVTAFGPNFFCQTGTGCGGACGQVCAPECGTAAPWSTATEGAQSNA